jgi:molecular chaperone DnaK
VDLSQHPEASARLLKEAENIKHLLSDLPSIDITLEELTYGLEGKPVGMQVSLTREQFEAMVAPIVDRSIARAREVLGEAGIGKATVDEIVLAGGATKVPLVRRRVAELFGREPRAEIDPMVVVASGAALHAANLTRPVEVNIPSGILLDVTSHALGIATAGGFTEPIIKKNAVIPVESSRLFTTAQDGQTTVRIRVYQGHERRFEDNVPIGELVLDQLRAAPRGTVKVEVLFLVDANGILNVVARDVATGRQTAATLSIFGLARQFSRELLS